MSYEKTKLKRKLRIKPTHGEPTFFHDALCLEQCGRNDKQGDEIRMCNINEGLENYFFELYHITAS